MLVLNATKTQRHEISQMRNRKHLIAMAIFFSLIACNPKQTGKALPENKITGNWAFLDGRGNYNEAYFADSSFVTYNMVMGKAPEFSYLIRNDSLFTNTNKRKKGLNRIAKVEWLAPDKVIFTTEFSKDTLERITDEEITLGTIDPAKDSVLFRTHITRRYERYLVDKGIISADEMDAFKKQATVPKDVMEKGK